MYRKYYRRDTIGRDKEFSIELFNLLEKARTKTTNLQTGVNKELLNIQQQQTGDPIYWRNMKRKITVACKENILSSLGRTYPFSKSLLAHDPLYDLVEELTKRAVARINQAKIILCRLKAFGVDPEYRQALLYGLYNHLAESYSKLTLATKEGASPLTNPHLSSRQLSKYIVIKGAQVAALGAAAGAKQFGNALGHNIKQQMWMHVLLGFISQVAYLRTLTKDIATMELDTNGTVITPGVISMRYKTDGANPEINHQNNLTAHVEGLLYCAAVYVTDYLEVKLDAAEYINAWLAGVQQARIDCGMVPVYMENPVSIAKALQGLRQLKHPEEDQLPWWLRNATQLASSVAFKIGWQALVVLVGAAISVLGDLLKGSLSALAGGIVGVLTSMLVGLVVNAAWQAVYQSYAEMSWRVGYQGHWTYYAKGDKHVDWKIKAYKTAMFLSNMGYWFDWQLAGIIGWPFDLLIQMTGGGGSVVPIIMDFFRIFYLNTYFDLGPFGDAFSNLGFLITMGTIAYLCSTETAIALLGILAPIIGLVACVFIIAYVVVFVIFWFVLPHREVEPSTVGDDPDWLP